MAQILELLTINVAVESLDRTIPKYEGIGLSHVAPVPMPEPPAEITDVSFPMPKGGAVSLIEATGPTSPVARFLEKKGQGVYSIAVRVDDLRGAMKEWGELGLRWVLDEPAVLEDAPAVDHKVERLLMNWVKPSSMDGVMLEVFEFQGAVSAHD
jgi:methylmalonyl-CoA/ethylmalonyl-CoA epimerase